MLLHLRSFITFMHLSIAMLSRRGVGEGRTWGGNLTFSKTLPFLLKLQLYVLTIQSVF